MEIEARIQRYLSNASATSEILECNSSPCAFGTCTELIDGFTCVCQSGYTGTNCDIGTALLNKLQID